MFRNQNAIFQRVRLGAPTEDVPMQDAEPMNQDGISNPEMSSSDNPMVNGTGLKPDRNRLIIAIDFGTTFSTVAYVAIEPGEPNFLIRPEHVLCVDHYPDIPPGQSSADILETYENVPTELWYGGGASEDCQSGSDISSEVDLAGYWSDSSNEDSASAQQVSHGRLARYEKSQDLLWGFGVQSGRLKSGAVGDASKIIERFKLMLDTHGGKTTDIRQQLAAQAKLLKRSKAITCQEQMISDYLEQTLKHAKARLEATGDLRPGSQIEFVLCVPNLWSETACRTMHDAMATAIRASRLGGLSQECIDNLFIVAEPEAAAEFVLSSFLESQKIRPGETLVMLDAGGGTVDATTYRVTRTDPLRLEKQAVVHDGDLCGSSFLNQNYKKRILERLEDEQLPIQGAVLKNFVDGVVTAWEIGEKRRIDTEEESPNDVFVMGLQAAPEKGFKDNYMKWSRDEMKAIFDPILKDVVAVLRRQLGEAHEKGICVSKVVLIGGFSESPSLVQVLKGYLSRTQNIRGNQIELLIPERFRTSAVARGAVLRALRKEHGPQRFSRSSFGFLRTEHYDPDEHAAHKDVSVKRDPVDGLYNVDNTIYWVIQKGQLLAPRHQHDTIVCWHTFTLSQKRLICREELCISDKNHEPHYRLRHWRNRGAKRIAYIDIDMTYLKTQGGLLVETVPADAPNANKQYYKIVFGLVMIVEGRNLRFEVRYPWDSKEAFKSAQVSIASAFAPGTA